MGNVNPPKGGSYSQYTVNALGCNLDGWWNKKSDQESVSFWAALFCHRSRWQNLLVQILLIHSLPWQLLCLNRQCLHICGDGRRWELVYLTPEDHQSLSGTRQEWAVSRGGCPSGTVLRVWVLRAVPLAVMWSLKSGLSSHFLKKLCVFILNHNFLEENPTV